METIRYSPSTSSARVFGLCRNKSPEDVWTIFNRFGKNPFTGMKVTPSKKKWEDHVKLCFQN